jgi:hypothetical protein
MAASWMGWLLGAALGMRHALEPDHLAAVSTMVAQHKNPRAGVLLGALWGLGHSLGLLALGGVLALLQRGLPDVLANALELGVAVMLCVLGVRAVQQAAREARQGDVQVHQHGGAAHAHPSAGPHLHVANWTLLRRPLMVGLMHGLAGSGALVALVLAQLPSTGERILYMGLFGLGSIMGMAAITGVAGLGLSRLVARRRFSHALLTASGLLSVGVGLAWGVECVSRLAGV